MHLVKKLAKLSAAQRKAVLDEIIVWFKRAELRAVQGNRVVRIDERLRNSARKGALKKLVIACSTLPHADVITML